MRSKFTVRLVKGTHLWELSVYEAGNKVGWYQRFPAPQTAQGCESLAAEVAMEIRNLAGRIITYRRVRGPDNEVPDICTLQD